MRRSEKTAGRTFAIGALATALSLGILTAPRGSDAASEGTAPVGVNAPLFSISKTENRNYVQFAEQLDANCAPFGSVPVHAYWRMLERGPATIEPLLAREEPAYGVASQSVIERNEAGGVVRVTLRALSSAPLLVESRRRTDGGCEASARTSIAGVEARLINVHAVLKWPFGISRLLVSGWSLADGHPVRDSRAP